MINFETLHAAYKSDQGTRTDLCVEHYDEAVKADGFDIGSASAFFREYLGQNTLSQFNPAEGDPFMFITALACRFAYFAVLADRAAREQAA